MIQIARHAPCNICHMKIIKIKRENRPCSASVTCKNLERTNLSHQFTIYKICYVMLIATNFNITLRGDYHCDTLLYFALVQLYVQSLTSYHLHYINDIYSDSQQSTLPDQPIRQFFRFSSNIRLRIAFDMT